MIQLPLQTSYINGRLQASQSGDCLENFYPGNNQKICDFEVALEPEIELAVQAAESSLAKWQSLSGMERGRVLHRASQILRQRVDELAKLEVYDTGKPISEALEVDIFSAAEALEYFAGLAPAIHGEHLQLGKNFAYTRREPLGVVAGIGAWNYPLQIACWKSAPALAAGNAMIYKPSELTPLSAVELAIAFQDAGLPAGVFNVVLGGHRTGELLVQHPRIQKISVTGSVPTGKRIMANAAQQLKQVTCELGGKSPLIVFDDANLDNAVKATLMANFYTQGEICSNGTRVFVHHSIYPTFLQKLVDATRALKIGDPLDPTTQVGSLISPTHCQKVMDYIESGIKAGAKLACGGRRVGEEMNCGNFVQPTIFTDCQDDMQIVREEIFGPVLSLLTFENEAEVIERANRTDFGLAAGVFTNDLNRAHRVIAELDAGTCWINTYNITPLEIPFGGFKQSGIGLENSPWALHHYTRLKSVYVEMGDI